MEQLKQYEAFQREMELCYKEELQNITSPHFATYATLQRGLGYEREYIAWCRWVADQLERAVNATHETISMQGEQKDV